MNFCIISPTAGLKRYSTLSKNHLVLAHIEDRDYISFYRKRREEGDHLILDNGAHEQGSSVSWRQLEIGIINYHPQVVVLPDTLNDSYQTARDALLFLDKYSSRYPEVEWMYVPQGKEFASTTIKVLTDLRSGYLISWLGISRYLTINHACYRTEVASMFKQTTLYRDKGIKFHALGMVNGSVGELNELRSSRLFESIDSSVPVWRGWNGYNLSTMKNKWPEISVNFSSKDFPNEDYDHQIRLNLEACGVDTSSLR